jgi:hypothetical protein
MGDIDLATDRSIEHWIDQANRRNCFFQKVRGP